MATQVSKKPQITAEQIVDEALALLKETNLAGLTMRVLADRLGIKAASLYWHFPNKGALEAAMSQRIFISNTLGAPDADNLKEYMRSAGRYIWATLIDCPDSGLLIRKAEITSEQFQQTMDIVRQRLAKYNVDENRALKLYAGVEAIIGGWITFAQSPYGAGIEEALQTEKTVFETLDALIEGWDMTPEG